MERYDFEASVTQNIIDALDDILSIGNMTEEEIDELDPDDYRDELWQDDSVVGCRCGTWEAEEHLCHNMDLLDEAMIEFGSDFINGWNAQEAESTVREYVFVRIYDNVFDEYVEDRR